MALTVRQRHPVNWKTNRVKQADTEEHILHDYSIYIMYRNRENYSLLLEARRGAAFYWRWGVGCD